jgi:hypothetical protein
VPACPLTGRFFTQRNGDAIIVIQQQNNLSTNTQNEHLHRLVITDEAVQRQQPVLAVQIGYRLDPGIRRKDRPNEDTIYVMQGKIPSDLAKPMPTPTDTAQSLIQAALAGGGKDNVSAIVARVSTY